MSMLEGGSTVLGSDILEAESNDYLKKKLQAYKDFDFSQINRNPLAIDTHKDEILDLLTKESAIIIKGFTGCGKSTQVPQFILDDHYQRKVPCNIVVTQPRRIAAITIAQRVCRERNWPMSTVVGYQVHHFMF
jgi:ATP-dependent RNA helicase TDRD9